MIQRNRSVDWKAEKWKSLKLNIKKNFKNVKKKLTFSANRTASFSVQDFTLIGRKTG